MVSLEKWMILTPLIVANGFKKLPKVQYIAKSGHTDPMVAWKLIVQIAC